MIPQQPQMTGPALQRIAPVLAAVLPFSTPSVGASVTSQKQANAWGATMQGLAILTHPVRWTMEAVITPIVMGCVQKFSISMSSHVALG